MPLVTRWTGREVKALREAARMSLMEFAEKLGVSDRIVSKWEQGGESVSPRMVNQAALDTLFSQADADAQGRFVKILSDDDVPTHQIIVPDAERQQCLSQIFRQLGVAGEEQRPDRMLTWDQVRLMKSHGIDFGGHTVTHARISSLSPDDARFELKGSRDRLVERLRDQSLTTWYAPRHRPGGYFAENIRRKCLPLHIGRDGLMKQP